MRSKMRTVREENPYSASGRVGVSYCAARTASPWKALIERDGQRFLLGYFDNVEDASQARQQELLYPTKLTMPRRGIRPAFLNDGTKIYKCSARLYYQPIRSAINSYVEIDIGYYPSPASALKMRVQVENVQFPSLEFLQDYLSAVFDFELKLIAPPRHVHTLPSPTALHKFLPKSITSCECGCLFSWEKERWVLIDGNEEPEFIPTPLKFTEEQLQHFLSDPTLDSYREKE